MSGFIHHRSSVHARRSRLSARLRRGAAFLAAILFGATWVAAQAQSTTAYDWKNVKIAGGGFITHIVPDPSTPGTMYARTDVGGAYKIDKCSNGKWRPLTDIFGPIDASLLGTESIAVDPVEPERIYLAQGMYDFQGASNGVILTSKNGGKDFARVNMSIPMGADEPGRFSGERLAVDPQHHGTIYFGSRDNGLWKSSDFGQTWAQVTSFPVTGPTSGVGVIFEVFVPTGTKPKTETIYVGVSDPNVGLYSSTNGGATWSPVAGQPTGYYPTNYDLSPDGNLYITYGNATGPDTLNGQGFTDGQLYKYNTSTGVWTAVTPPNPWGGVDGGVQSDGFGFSAVSVDRQNPKTIMVATMGRLYWPGEEIFRSLDGGATWWPIGSEPSWSEPGPLYNFSSRTNALAPYWSDPSCGTTSCDLTAAPFGTWLGALVIDPFDSNHVLYGTATGIWETRDVTDVDSRQVIDWTVGADGIEELPVTALVSPAQGIPLISGIGNYVGGFSHASLDTSPAAGSIQPNFTPSSMDFAQNGTTVIVRVGGSNGSYSTDDGSTWTAFTPPTSLNTIAVSSDGSRWVASASNGVVMYSTSFGSTWNNSSGLPAGVNVVSDRVNPLEFYAYSSSGGALYRSTDGGVTFPIVTSAPQWGSGIYAGYAAEGDLWIPNWTLNHSTDKGATFNAPSGSVGSITALGFGQPAPGSSIPTLFMAGQVSGVSGIYRSTNGGGSWSQINDVKHQWGSVSVIAGDQQVFGRVYIGTSGRGILYGDDPDACLTCHYKDKTNPVIAWNKPAAVSVGAVLSGAELNATASAGGNSLPGAFIYTPPAGTVMSGTGTATLRVRFEPEDYADYNSVTAEVTLKVNGGSLDTAKITWPAPAGITYGTALSSSQLDATANYPGTFSYSPALGTILGGGSQELGVTFTPGNQAKVAPAFATTTIKVDKAMPTVTVALSSSSITVVQPLSVTIAVSGPGSTPTGSVILSSGSYSLAATLISGSAAFTIPRGSLAAGAGTLTVTYKPDQGSSANYSSASGNAQVTVTPLIAPTVTVTPDATTLPYAENLIVAATVTGGNGGAAPTGAVALTSGSYTSSVVTLSSGTANFYIQPGTLPHGGNTLTVNYVPDASASATYLPSTGTSPLNLTAPGSTSIALNIDASANRHIISPYIYGINSTTKTDISNLSPAFVRFGGNEATNYNWKLHTYNAGGDYFYEDYGLGDPSGNPVDTVGLTQFTVSSGSHQLNTMPLLDWLAQQTGWSFSVNKFGPQCKTDYYNSDAGDGLKPDCQTPVTTEQVTDAYYPLVDTAQDCPSGTTDGTTCLDRQSYAQDLSAAYGSETCNVPYSPITSCHFYDMDNEPEIWDGSHRDVHPNHPGYTELSNLFEAEGSALKAWDPSAVRFGPITCCWNFLWTAGPAGDDKIAHAGIDYAPWWLNQIHWLDQINGARTLDVFDLHAYFGDNISTTGFTNPQLRAEVAKYVRTYWDPTYYNAGDDADWITTTEPNRGVTFMIPRMKALVNAIYPGTPLSFTEWESFFNEWEFATALSDADAYGVMGREGLGFSTRWGGPIATDNTTNLPHPNYQSFKLYTNYDGASHGFGTISVSDQSSVSPDLFVSYAALNTAGTTMTIMVLNKDPNNTANVTFNLNGFSPSSYTAYSVVSTNPGSVTTSPSQSWSATQTFAPYSITLLVVNGAQASPPASEWYLNPDDLMVPASGTGTLQPAITSGTAPVTLTSAVFDAFEGAPACSGSLALSNSTITASNPGTITVNTGSVPGFCHYTVTGTDGTATQTQGGWIVVGQPAAALTVQSGNNQSGSAGSALPLPLTVTLTPPSGTTFTAGGASILFTTSSGTLSNGTTSGTSVIAQTNSSGVASVTLTLPSTSGTVTVTAQGQFALGGASVTFTGTAN
jgi:hypothetical protein